MNDAWWLFAALFSVWVGVGFYALILTRRQRDLERRVEELDERNR